MEKKELKRYLIIAFLIIGVCLVIRNFGLLANIIGIMFTAVFPLLLGAIIAYIFNIILSGFEKRYFPKSNAKAVVISRRPVCIVLSFLCAAAIIALILKIVIPELISAFRLIFELIPPVLDDTINSIIKKLDEYPDIQKEAMVLYNEFDIKSLDWASITGQIGNFLKTGVLGIISSAVGIVGSFVGTTTNVVIAIIFAIYLLLRKDKLLKDTHRFQTVLFKESTNNKVNNICRVTNDTFKSFFIGQFIEAILLGCFCFIGMKILQLPYAAMSGVLVGVTALIPIVGAFIGAGVSAFIIFTESPMQALVFIIFIVILQQLEGNIVYPKVVGDSIGLPGIWVLAAVTVGGGLCGIMGMLIGVPVAATAYKLIFEHLKKKEIAMGIESGDDTQVKDSKFSFSKFKEIFRKKNANKSSEKSNSNKK